LALYVGGFSVKKFLRSIF